MFFPFVLFAICALRYFQVQHTFALIDIPEEIKTFCPHSDFCEIESSHQLPTVDRRKLQFESCCKSCSCASDCGLNRTCCTPELDQYRLSNTLGAVCKPLNTQTDSLGKHETYFVVNKCPGKEEICSSMNISTWGSYSPVYSHSDGSIYHNEFCATCNNQANVVKLVPSLVCSSFQGPLSKIAINTLSDAKDSEDTCFVQFIVPPSIDISSQICHNYLVSDCTCTNDTAYYRRMRYLCGGLRALFRRTTMYYQNVFCFLCNKCFDDFTKDASTWQKYYTMCPVAWSERITQESSLVVLLDEGFRKDFEISLSESARIREVCFEKTNYKTKICRKVHCPEGHFRTGGSCTLLGKTWFVNNLQYLLNLRPYGKGKPLTRSTIDRLNIEDKRELYLQILNQFQMQDWEIQLLYNVEENGTAIQYMVAVLVLRTQEVKSSSLLYKVQTTLRRIWTLSIDGTNWQFKATFNKFKFYNKIHEFENSSYSPVWTDTTGMEPGYNYVDAGLIVTSLNNDFHFQDYISLNAYRLCVTKLFFCETVDIYEDEFVVIGFAQEEVNLVKQHKRLGNGEFVVSKVSERGPTEIRVCLYDMVEGKAVLLFPQLNIIALCQMLLFSLIM